MKPEQGLRNVKEFVFFYYFRFDFQCDYLPKEITLNPQKTTYEFVIVPK